MSEKDVSDAAECLRVFNRWMEVAARMEGAAAGENWPADVRDGAYQGFCAAWQHLSAELDELHASIELRHQADRRAIQRWREATGKQDVWPDHADLCLLLLKENAQLQTHARVLANQSALFRAELEKEQRRKAACSQAQIDAERDTNALLTDLLEKAEAEIERLRQAG